MYKNYIIQTESISSGGYKMDSTVLQSIQIRKDFFEKYYTVSSETQPYVDEFINELYALGENCNNSLEFEEKFASQGFQERFNNLLVRCTPKPYQMTEEEKATAGETANQIFEEDRERIIDEAVEEAVDYTSVMASEELLAIKRKMMIEAGVYDEYSRISNKVDIAKGAGSFIKGLFKKKK